MGRVQSEVVASRYVKPTAGGGIFSKVDELLDKIGVANRGDVCLTWLFALRSQCVPFLTGESKESHDFGISPDFA